MNIDGFDPGEFLVDESVNQGSVWGPRDLARYLQLQIRRGVFSEEMDPETLVGKFSALIGEWPWKDVADDDRMLKVALVYFAVLGTNEPKLTRHELRLVRRWYCNALREFGADDTEIRKRISKVVVNSDDWKDEVIRGLAKG